MLVCKFVDVVQRLSDGANSMGWSEQKMNSLGGMYAAGDTKI